MPGPSNLVPPVAVDRALVDVRLPAQPTGFVFLRERKRGPVWYAKYRLPDGRQVKKRIGPAWTRRGRAPEGLLSRREAEAWLDDVLGQARRGTLPGMVRTEVTFAVACEEYLHWLEHDPRPSVRRTWTVAGKAQAPSSGADVEGVMTVHRPPAAWRRPVTAVVFALCLVALAVAPAVAGAQATLHLDAGVNGRLTAASTEQPGTRAVGM